MRRIHVLLFVISLLSGIVMMVSPLFDPSLHVFRYAGYTMLTFLGIFFLSTGLVERQKVPETPWHAQPLVRLGMVLLFSVVLGFLTLDLRSLIP